MPKSEIDELYWNNPYYITPDGEAGSQAFAVIREAIKKENSVALGRVVFTTREHAVAIEARGKGLLGKDNLFAFASNAGFLRFCCGTADAT